MLNEQKESYIKPGLLGETHLNLPMSVTYDEERLFS